MKINNLLKVLNEFNIDPKARDKRDRIFKLTDEEFWKEANKGNEEILIDTRVSELRDKNKYTPLHLLGDMSVKEVLEHPDCSIVKNFVGYTPLHYLAFRGVDGVDKHEDFDKVKNLNDETPRDLYNSGLEVRRKLKTHDF